MSTVACKKHAVQIAVLSAVCLALFGNTLLNDFIWDDIPLISDNKYIRDCANIPLFFTPDYWNNLYPLSGRGDYRPVRTTSFALDYAVWKQNPVGYHFTNLLLHTINVILVYFWVVLFFNHKALNQSGQSWFLSLSFLTALFFAAHPVHTESVSYVKNRSELLCFLFFLVTFFVSRNFIAQKNIGKALILLMGALVSFCLAILSKEVALVFPAIFIAYVVCFLAPEKRTRAIIKTIPLGGLICLYFWSRHAMLLTTAKINIPIGIWEHGLAVLQTIGYYFWLMLFPVGLNAEHIFNIPDSLFSTTVLWPAIAVSLLLVLIVVSYKQSRLLCFGLCWIFLAILPMSNLVYLVLRPIAEQRLYLPSLGICLLLAMGLRKMYLDAIARSRRFKKFTAIAIVCAILLFFTAQTVRRNVKFNNAIRFYSVTIENSPNNLRAPYIQLGNKLLAKGRVDEAIANYQYGASLHPNDPNIHYNLGLVLAQKGDFEAAARHFQTVLQLDPVDRGAQYGLGAALIKMGDFDQAARHFNAVLKSVPDDAGARMGLAVVATLKGYPAEAITHYHLVLQATPDNANAYVGLGFCLFQAGLVDEAIEAYRAAVRLKPDYADAYYNLGRIFRELGDTDMARQYEEKAAGISAK